MKGLVLAAGLGTRLRPLTLSCAKPALPVLGVPVMWFGAWHLKRSLGIDKIALNVSHLPETVRRAGGDEELKRFTGIDFEYSDESSGILGSSGALWKLRDWIGAGETLSVCNGDTISFPAWRKMLENHRKNKASITLHVRAHSQSLEEYTDIVCAPDGRVVAFGEKKQSGLMFSGSYLFEPSLLASLPAGASELRPTLLEPLIKEGRLFAFREDIDWFDTGTLASYAQTQFDLLRALPEARELVEAKMREETAGIWVPRSWSHSSGKPALMPPAIVVGKQSEWADVSRVLGPRFIGIEPPMPGVQCSFQDALIFSNHIERI